MDLKCLLRAVLLSAVIAAAAASCGARVEDAGRCNYTVICDGNPGSVPNPTCEVEPYVTFIIRNSNLEHLTTGFFSATNFDSRVREVISIDNTWRHIEPSAFRYYSKSFRLDISSSNIETVENEAFRNLNYLLFLNVSNNNIKMLNPKSFLTSETRNNFVQELDLSRNVLTEISSEFHELNNLKKLYLQNNRISVIEDDSFMNSKNLVYLNLKNNRLKLLNLTLTNLKALKVLDISNNFLLKLSGYEVNRLSSINIFNASHNEIESVESNSFNQAYTLQKLDLSYNHIKTTIETVMFINNDKLEYIDLYSNNITIIQDRAFNHCNLSYLNLERNNITGAIGEYTFNGLIGISILDLSKQNISQIKNNAFSTMEQLVHLNLSTNHIEIIENASFVNTTVQVLDLSHNQVSDLYFLQNGLSNLTELYINNNLITVVPKYSFRNQTELKSLDLSMNRITTIEEYGLPLINLQYFKIFGNCLKGEINKNVFSPARYLRFLDMANFNLTSINDFAFFNLTLLARLNISNNQIQTVSPNNFMGVDNMYSLDMSYNNITNLTFSNSTLTHLKAVYLNNNKLTNVSRLFVNKCNLLYLDLSNNNIGNPIEIGSHFLPNLTVLHLANNKIIEFNNPKTDTLIELIDLGLSSNGIKEINLSYFKDLMTVDLSNNDLSYINSTLFEHNAYLHSLDLSRNNIKDIPPGTFQYMKTLKLLNMSSNFLTKLRYGSLRGLHKTELLDLSRNNIEVLDVDIFHECNELKTLVIDYNRIKTFDVERLILISLRQLRTLSLGGNPISCKEIVHNMKTANVTFFALRQVEVTSIDKVYHEDNVHGIKCGDDAVANTTEPPDSPNSEKSMSSTSSVVAALIWCTVITIILVTGGVLVYVKLYRNRVHVNSNMTMNMRESLDLDGSDFQSDLLH
ncbi:unnamed protein product [Chrysodeixis includens]|uniref:Uncharacterized protein n=1 Tax=Chrysodeixis includens TaxID=689277 RepID=A0A9P0FRA3_CHRIL|nr:unnamed protein product [Chrysodeixis includens]